MTWGIYCRISKDHSGQKEGIERQKKDCAEFAEQHGLQVAETYQDNDISAFSGAHRPGYEQMLQDIKAGRIKGVICWHLDRLYRRSIDLEGLVDLVEETGVEVRSVKAGDLDLNTATGRMMARMVATIANYEVDHAIERQVASHESRAADGKYRGGYITYGYEKGDTPGTLKVVEHEAKIIQEAVRDVLAGKTLLSIVRHLNRRGVPTKNNTRWRSSTVRKALLNPDIAALATYRGEIVGKAQWEPIIEEDDWYAARSILTDPARRTQQGTERRWQGSGVYECGKCGGKMFQRSGAYLCFSCWGVSRHRDRVDALIDELVVTYLSQPENQLHIAGKAEGSGEDVAGLLEERRILVARKDSLGEMFASGLIDRSQLVTGTREVGRRIEDLDGRISAARQESPVLGLVLGGDDLRERWGAMSADMRAGIIDSLVRVTILPAKSGPGFDPSLIRIEWK